MKKKILIIRSVSFQQLDKNLNALVKEFPAHQYELHLLTHGHGMERAKTYKALSKIIDYSSRKNFTFFHLPTLLHKKYDAIIIPVTNTTGTGFLNVQALALRIPARKIYICNMVSRIWEISQSRILMDMFKGFVFTVFSLALTLPAALILVPPLLLGLLFRKVKGEASRVKRRG